MSGTSGDGIDASVISSNGLDQFEVIKNNAFPSANSLSQPVKNIFSHLLTKFRQAKSKKTTKNQSQSQKAKGKGTILHARRASAVADYIVVLKVYSKLFIYLGTLKVDEFCGQLTKLRGKSKN